jgi:hypothetical protein
MEKNSKPKGRKWDGKSRVSNDLYRKNFSEIFNKKSEESYEQSKLNKKEREELQKIIDRNGF